MVDWNTILHDLKEMSVFFEGCKVHAASDSNAAKTYASYVNTIRTMSTLIDDMLNEEDDGK